MRSVSNPFSLVLSAILLIVLAGCSSSSSPSSSGGTGSGTGSGSGSGTGSSSTPDFTLSVSPSTTLTLTSGQTGQTVSVIANALNSFTGTVAVTFTGLPSGVTASSASLSLTPGTAQTVTLSAAPGTASTNSAATVTFTGTSGTLTHTAAATLAVVDSDFTLAVSQPSLVITSGQAGKTLSLTASPVGTFTSPVAITISGLPKGVTANPATLTLTPGAAQTLTLTAASGATAASSVPVTFTGVAGALSHTATTALSIGNGFSPAPPDFTLTVAPTTLSLQDGAPSQTFTVTENAQNGYSSPLAASLSGLPNGVTASPATLTLTPNLPQTFTLTATNAAAGVTNVLVNATDGTLAHTAALVLTTVPAPSFALSIAPTAQTLSIGNLTGAQIAVSASAANGFTGPVNISLSNLPTGVTAAPATLSLTPGTPQNITLTAGYSAVAGSSSVSFNGTAGTLSQSTSLNLTIQAAPIADVTTYHYDNARDGLNAQETILTPAKVNASSFGLTTTYSTDGKVDAQPLFAAQVPTSLGATANVLYVASEHDTLYAFNTATGATLWQTSLLHPGESTSDPHSCSQITPEIGITSTPVIDRTIGANGTIFVVGMTKDVANAYHQRLHALDLSTGAEQPGSPVEISATYPNAGGSTSFAPGQYAERAALLLLNGTVYLSWTSHCDQQPYTGWVMGYSATTLQQTQVLNLTPNGSEGSIWMSGNGPSADISGNFYLLDANGTFTDTINAQGFPSKGDYGNGILKLSAGSGTLSVTDYFEPYNTASESNADIDLGSGGAMLLPDVIDSGGNTRHLLVGAGKDTNIYVVDRDNMGKFNATSNINVYQELPGALAHGAWSSPAYFNQNVFYAGQNDVLKAFPIASARLGAPSSQSSVTFPYPGSTPTISANGSQGGIVWAVESGTGTPGVLHAYDATNLSSELYNSNQNRPSGTPSTFGLGNKFITPMVIDGNVYVGTPSGVAVFGLLP